MNVEQPILTISVAARLLGLHPRTLMFYEKHGLISPHRTIGKHRLYTPQDIKELQFLKYLTHGKKVNLRGAKFLLEALRIAKGQGCDLVKNIFPDFKVRELI